MDTYEAFEQAVRATESIVKGIATDQLDNPTPCTEWSVRDVLNHAVGTLYLHESLVTDSPAPYGMRPAQLPDRDLVGDNPLTAYRAASASVLAAMRRPGAIDQPHATPLGDLPGSVLAGFTTMDMYVHGWDLARATGQPDASFDPALAEHILGFVQQAITDESRGLGIGAAVTVPDDAPVVDRLVGFLGRTP